MARSQKPNVTCGRCNKPVRKKDRYCTNCGGLFSDKVFCVIHKTRHAVGVCVTCAEPYCQSCCSDSDNIFLCDEHSQYEITEGMARVFGSTDNVQTQFAVTWLQQRGFHPFLYSRLFKPTADKVAISALRNFGNHPIEEEKVLVPFPEVLLAKQELKKHNLKEV